jgi:3-oxoacyl-[acyl-carrier-protein] synthase-3
MDFPVSHLQSDFNMSRAFVMGVNQTACTSLLGSLRVAKALLASEPNLIDVLCLTADRFPNGAKYEQGYNLISDGAACCSVSKQKGQFRIVDCHQISNGAMARASDEETAGFYFNYTCRSLTEILQRNEMVLDDINWIVPQNTNVKAWQVLSSVLNFDFEKVLMPTRREIGHCISGDNIINLMVANDRAMIGDGERILMPMAGFGLNWSCVILEKVI